MQASIHKRAVKRLLRIGALKPIQTYTRVYHVMEGVTNSQGTCIQKYRMLQDAIAQVAASRQVEVSRRPNLRVERCRTGKLRPVSAR